ncbi:hypothetical protein [Treponema sp. J25]|uniref:hypothetical protein n=1 Tax=Treponema sp. J25 TaxID=2094121 RepID=UPI00104F9DC3|nr:hypothetical protein [Treponema sp. J25]TCW60384.1 hypothetical protein C5O22_12015 [Treponema sp. J25]
MNRKSPLVCFILLTTLLPAEGFRTILKGNLDISTASVESKSITLSYTDAVLITIDSRDRFLKGIEFEIRMPQIYTKYRDSIGFACYTTVPRTLKPGIVDIEAERVYFEVLPGKIQSVYQIPLRENHGLRSSPYVKVLTPILSSKQFPLLIRFMPLIKGLSEEIERLEFTLSAKPILADEGVLRLHIKTPEHLKDKPYSVFLDEVLWTTSGTERLLKTGTHFITIVSDYFRTESRSFIIERAKILDLVVELEDIVPLVTIQAPAPVEVLFDNQPIAERGMPFQTTVGEHELLFRIGEYTLTKVLQVQKGKQYTINFSIDVQIKEE